MPPQRETNENLSLAPGHYATPCAVKFLGLEVPVGKRVGHTLKLRFQMTGQRTFDVPITADALADLLSNLEGRRE
jgi:hypothetical protein